MIELPVIELILRILFSILFGGIIGYDRERKGQSAGFRTHMLVSVGATMIALIQIKASNEILHLAMTNPDYFQIFSLDQTRLVAQIVSGIGFLGAGAIIVTKRSISGLTTAASIWATAAIGIAMGMGYYVIALTGTVSIVIVLSLIKNKLILVTGENVIIHYIDKKVKHQLVQYFRENKIKYHSAELRIENKLNNNEIVYSEHYVLNIPSRATITEIIQELGELENIVYVSAQPHII